MAVINYRNSTDDGWISISGYLTQHGFVFFINGDLTTGVHKIRIDNLFGYDLLVTKMKGYAITAPVGAGILIDILIDSVSALTSYFYISDGENENLLEDEEGFFIFTKNSTLSIEIIQIGSSVAGADLSFQIGATAL